MSTPITPVATIPPATYPIPAPGDGVTSANTAQYVQPIANGIAWLKGILTGAVSAAVTFTGAMVANTINAASIVCDVIHTKKTFFFGALTGVNSYDPANVELVIWNDSGSPPSSPTWKPTNRSYTGGEFIRFTNLSITGSVIVKDPAGITTIATLINTSGSIFSVELLYTGAVWTVSDYGWRP